MASEAVDLLKAFMSDFREELKDYKKDTDTVIQSNIGVVITQISATLETTQASLRNLESSVGGVTNNIDDICSTLDKLTPVTLIVDQIKEATKDHIDRQNILLLIKDHVDKTLTSLITTQKEQTLKLKNIRAIGITAISSFILILLGIIGFLFNQALFTGRTP